MKMKPSQLLKLEHLIIEEIKTKLDISLPSIPIEDNLSLSYSIFKAKEDGNKIAIKLTAKTIKKTQLYFSVKAVFFFSVKNQKVFSENKNKVLATALTISYSTLRGILIREIPFADPAERILPVIDIPELIKAKSKKSKK